jgi:hypothetical protein
MMTERRKEVEKMLWDLRKVVQMSHRIGLVFTGSGLQRIFVEGYDKALHSSIAQHELGPFGWEQDQKASQSTFLPERLRSRLCAADRFEEISEHAHNLSGGNPHYLAILGYSSAILLNGHRWTRAGLDQVVERILQGELRTSGTGLGVPPSPVHPDQFYAPTFESLKRLPAYSQALAKITLAHIAERTSTNHPWLQKWTAVAAPDAVTLTRDEERWSALATLENERVLETDSTRSQVRIRVPLTASAIREHGYMIRQAAVRTLKTRTN